MIFTELRFLAFFGVVFAVFWLLGDLRARKSWLLIASYAFYAAWDWRFLSLIWISTLVDYLVGLRLRGATSRRRLWLTVSVVANLGILGFFKYFGFFAESAASLLTWLGFEPDFATLQIVLPVGISFYTFQTMSYSIDVYRGRIEATRNLLDLALFVAFFPQLVAGPIVRARTFLPQLRRQPDWRRVAARSHLLLFLAGYVKKACISDNIAPTVDAFFAAPESYGTLAAWCAILLYAVQIYCDFSGYSDMAIASAGLLGFDLPLNFDRPYLAHSIRDFWRRWHISLSTWLRDYLYVPLGGNRRGARRTYLNLMLTMVLGGLWHGAAWHFVLWGALHGVVLCLERLAQGLRRGAPARGAKASAPDIEAAMPPPTSRHAPGRRPTTLNPLPIALTLFLVCLGWVIFRAPDLGVAGRILALQLGLGGSGTMTIDPRWWLLLLLLAVVHATASNLHRWRPAVERLPAAAFAAGYGVLIALVLPFVRTDVQPFIYFQF